MQAQLSFFLEVPFNVCITNSSFNMVALHIIKQQQ